MRSLLLLLCCVVPTATLVYLAINPGTGLLYREPTAGLWVGLMGLGLCLEIRRHARAARR